MPDWNYRINIKQYLNREGDNIVIIAENVANELRTVPVVFGSLPTKLVETTKAAVERIPDEKEYHELKFNQVLARIYDVADDYRVWLGMM